MNVSFIDAFLSIPKSWHVRIYLTAILLVYFIHLLIGHHKISSAASTLNILSKRSEIAGDIYKFSQAVESLEATSILSCTTITLLKKNPESFLNNLYKAECNSYLDAIMSFPLNEKITSLSKIDIHISSRVPIATDTAYILIFISVLTTLLLYLLSTIYIFNRNITLKEVKMRDEAAKEIYKITKQIAHDIRSPLTVLVSVASLSKEKFISSQELISATATRVHKIAEDLLAISKEQQTQRPRILCTDPVASLSHLIQEFELKGVAQNAIVLQKNYIGNPMLKMDNSTFKRVISNLIQNSIEATDKPGIEIDLSTEKKFLKILISDNGPGLNADHLSKAGVANFSTKGVYGNGLGLSYCRQEVLDVGGKIHFENKTLGSGFCITLLIPIV